MTTATPPAATLQRAMILNPYEQLERLRAQSLARVHMLCDEAPPPTSTPEELLAELALATAVQHTWLRLQPPTVHLALTVGASIYQVAAAVGVRERLCAEAWLRWARRQAEHCERLQVDRPLATSGQIAQIVQRHPEFWPDGVA